MGTLTSQTVLSMPFRPRGVWLPAIQPQISRNLSQSSFSCQKYSLTLRVNMDLNGFSPQIFLFLSSICLCWLTDIYTCFLHSCLVFCMCICTCLKRIIMLFFVLLKCLILQVSTLVFGKVGKECTMSIFLHGVEMIQEGEGYSKPWLSNFCVCWENRKYIYVFYQ